MLDNEQQKAVSAVSESTPRKPVSIEDKRATARAIARKIPKGCGNAYIVRKVAEAMNVSANTARRYLKHQEPAQEHLKIARNAPVHGRNG